MYNPLHGTLVTTLDDGKIFIVTGVTPSDGLPKKLYHQKENILSQM